MNNNTSHTAAPGAQNTELATRRIWIDLENSPHVPFFLPILAELKNAGCEVYLTARDFAQTRALVQAAGLDARIVGGEWGSTSILKRAGLALRALRLARIMRGRHLDLAVGHGSRGLLLAANLLGIPTLTLYDYEGASVRLFNRMSDFVMTPEAIPFSELEKRGLTKPKHRTYPGLKEDVYTATLNPNPSILRELKLDPSRIILAIRPPSHTAHYQSEESFRIYDEMMTTLESRPDVQIIVLPRERSSVAMARRYFGNSQIVVPNSVVDGPNLIYYSDVVISGGGTMAREAAALGVPSVTIFKGETGAVDHWLIDQGRMISIDRADDLLPLLKKRVVTPIAHPNDTRNRIVETILQIRRHQ